MNDKYYKLTAIAAFIAATATQSCKKDAESPSRAAQLTGTWNAYQTGIDSNSNGVWEPAERRDVAPNAGGQLSFTADGQGRLKGDTTLAGAPFTWTLSNNENDLRLILNIPNLKPDTEYFSLIDVSASELILRNVTAPAGVYSSLRKQ